jgi:TRAP-type mannitol/chloroaromatic compound transport system permease large subunit
MTALALLLGLLVLVLINVPIAVALGLLAAVAMVWKSGADSLLTAAVEMFNGAKSFPPIAIPLFVLAGAIMNTSGISRRLIAFASALLGRSGVPRRTAGGEPPHRRRAAADP